jgi:glyoxalase family protein
MNLDGVHHVTCITGDAPRNVDFYTRVLGLRLVKKSVNQDDPGTYHLFYADAEGHPGTDLTFFPWEHMAPPRIGHGLAVRTSLEVPRGSLEYWTNRLVRYGTKIQAIESRFGDRSLPFVDPHGLHVALVEPGNPADRGFTAWPESTVPSDHQVRGLYGAEVWERESAPTSTFLVDVLGFKALGTEDGVTRYGFDNVAGAIDVRETPGASRGAWGVGCVHHLAWRVDDDDHQRAVRTQVAAVGGRPTEVIDRFWFKSVYFREPGGVLFELATDGPGFAADEAPEHLGELLVLPPWLEAQRSAIERALPVLSAPALPPLQMS